VSNTAYVAVTPHVEVALSAPSVPAGGSVTATGTVAPGKSRATVSAYLQRADGTQRRVLTRSVAVRRGTFRAGIRLKSAGSYRIVARVAADGSSLGGRSQPVAVDASPPA